jgi:16S rRNA (adenine1518-N6/adenine1519-N6)-dimethyltransferase
MINYNSASALRAFLDKEGLGMRKKFGQNFLINPATRQALVNTLLCEGGNIAQSGDEVWEIGPGLGAMTAILLEKGLSVKAFEIDAGFIRILKNLFSEEKKISLVEGDVMKTWHAAGGQYIQKPALPYVAAPFLLGNLPYNVAASLLADFIEKGCLFTRMVVTVQKEVALRMAASAGSPDYSSFSVLCASVYRVKPLMLIRPSSFYPQPNVDSMGVLLENRNCEAYPDVFYPLVRSLFASRRKTIKNNMTGFLSSRFGNILTDSKSIQDLCVDLLAKNGLSGIERAENLEMEVFLSLAKSIDNMRI